MSNDGHVLRAYVFMPDGYTPLLMMTFEVVDQNDVVSACYAYHNDHLSTPRAMTDDAGTGLYYNWHRYYVPGLGVYARADPRPPAWYDAFAYSRGSPVAFADPSGLAWVYIWDEGEENDSTFGHAAIESEDGSEYLSAYPLFQYFTKGEDVSTHNDNEADHVFHIADADEDALKKFIRERKSSWSPWSISNNCVDAVVEALDAAKGSNSLSSSVSDQTLFAQPQDLYDALTKFGYEEEDGDGD
jgi:RHS repeat-associated protein